MYPVYGALYEIPQQIGCEISYWKMDPDNGWKASLEDLKSLLKPETKMLILNNPHNPTGSVLSTETLKSIIDIARQHNIIVFEDEIFRPLFQAEPPSSILELGYERTIATGSLSKAWGFSGIRLGWVVTKDKDLRDEMVAFRWWILESISFVDEIIGSEVLSERCSRNILDKNIGYARKNLAPLRSLLEEHKGSVSCALPGGAATAFVKFTDPNSGQAVDDVEFCKALLADVGVLVSPGSLCFGPVQQGDFKGHIRLHMTAPPERFREGISRIARFLTSEKFTRLSINDHSGSNGTAG